MNIAIFTNNYLPNPYGVPMSVETFRHDFEHLGHTVYIFAPRWPGYKDTNPNVYRYPSLDIEIKIRFPLAIPYSRKISKILENLDLDIIHSQHPNLLGTAAMKWARRKKIPLVFTWHTLHNYYAHFAKFIPKKLAAWYIIRKAVNYANKAGAVVVPTVSIIPILKSWGVKKEMIPVATGVVGKDFLNPDRNKIRKKYNITDDEVLLLLVSRLTSEKNIEFVFHSMKSILKNNNKVKLLVSGEGHLVPELNDFIKKEKLEKKIILTGIVNREDIKDYYAAGDIFVYGSKSETQGMIITEAMYSGLPIVAVNATGTSSLVRNNINGFLVNEDGKEFTEAVQKLVADANLRQEFSEASKKITLENFTSDICAKKMLEMYGEAIRDYSK